MTIGKTGRRSRRGFSLLELLAVMSIMAMLSTLAVTSYFSAVRGMTRRSAVKHLANTLVVARQRACLEGSRMSVMIFNELSRYEGSDEIVVPSYVICKEVGRISYISDGKLVDEFAPLDKMFGSVKKESDLQAGGELNSMKLYNLAQGNLAQGGWWCVYPLVLQTKDLLSGRESAYYKSLIDAGMKDKIPSRYYQRTKKCYTSGYEIPAFAFVENTKIANPKKIPWSVGDSYGVEAAPMNSLPRGFQFNFPGTGKGKKNDSTAKPICITFEPDGRSSHSGDVVIEEMYKPNKSVTISVKAEGSITYDEVWR